MYRKLCHGVVTHDKPVEGNARDDKLTMNATFERKSDFDFEVNLVEETIPSQRNVWNHCTGNGNSGMDAVSQANGIDKTQLSKGHGKRPKKRTWKIEPLSNLIHGMAEGAQLNVNGTPQDEPLCLHDLRDKLSVTRMQICSLKVPTATGWSNGSCNGPAAPFKAMWIQYGRFGKLEVSHDQWEPVRNPDETKLEFCGERSSVTLYKQERKPNSTALQFLGENWDVAAKNDLLEKKKQNAAQRLSSQLKSLLLGAKRALNTKEKTPVAVMLEILSIY